MTSRGNSSISPPVQQIPVQSQQRQVAALPSGTPPPQQHFFQGQTSLPQGVYEFHPQNQSQQPGQQLLSYQAYGSTPNEIRVSSGSGRGGPPQQGLAQGGAYYQQPNQNMRSQQQQQQPQQQQPYYISAQPANNLRQQRPQQQIFMLPQTGIQAGGNVVIAQGPPQAAQNVNYARVPLFTPPQGGYTQFMPNPNNYQTMFYQSNTGNMLRGPMVTGTQRAAEPRVKKLIEIKDPNTGRDLTAELCQRPQSADSTQEEEPQANQKKEHVQAEFARRVAELHQAPLGNGSPVQMPLEQHQVTENGLTNAPFQQPNQPTFAQQSSQQTGQQFAQPGQQIPPQAQQQQKHLPNISRPQAPMMQPGQNTCPEMIPTGCQGPKPPLQFNVNVPPPSTPQQVRGSAPVFLPQGYSTAAQQQISQGPSHQMSHVPAHAPTPVTSAPHPHTNPQAQASSQQHAPPSQPPLQHGVPPQSLQHVQRPQMSQPNTRSSASAPIVPTTPPVQTGTQNPMNLSTKDSSSEHQQTPITPDTVVPVKPTMVHENSEPLEKTVPEATLPDVNEHIPNPVVKEKSASPPKEAIVSIPAAGEPATIISKEMTPPAREDSPPKSDDSTGASIQHGRSKNKKKKDFSRKDNIGGSDMDAFIDGKDVETVESKPPLPPVDKPTSAEQSPITQEAKVFSYAAAATATEKPKETSPPPVSPAEDKSITVQEQESNQISPPEVTKSSESNQNTTKEKSPTPTVVVEPPVSKDAVESTASEDAVSDIAEVMEAGVTYEPAKMETKKSEVELRINDENVPPKQLEPAVSMESKADVQVVPKVTRDENGRLVYDRSYLMELRGTEHSQSRPANLPDLEVILDTPMQSSSSSNKRAASMTGPDFTPSFFQPGVGNQRQPMGKSSSRGRPVPGDQMGGRMGPPQKVLTRLSMGNDVKPLHQAEKPWMPSVKTKTDKEGKSLEQETLFIMNRLTPTNFEKLAQEMRKLPVKTYEDLQELVKIFFDKVTIETKFVSAYASLCKVMAALKVPPPQGLKESQATFRVVMLTKCQQEFEADKSIIFEDPEKKRKELEAEIPADEPKRLEKIDFTLYQMKMKRLKFYGNIRFIGELFKLGMLTENIMHDCIFRLLKARDDDSLVSLCNLVTTVGKHLDTEKAKTRMDQYFTQMSKIADERKSRIKFTLKDVLELRGNNWIPRKADTGPKKIDEVHKDFEQEQATKQFLSNQPPPPRNDNPQNNRRNSRQRQEEKPADDGWNTVGSRTMKLDPGKMRLSKPSAVDENSIQLGPGGGMKFGMWSRGSFGGSTQQSTSQDERQPAPTNRFSALSNRQFERSPSRENNGRGMRQGSHSQTGRGKMSRSSQEGERRDLLASARSIVGGPRSQNSSRDNSWNREDRRQTFGPRSSHERDNPMTRSDITPRQKEEFRAPAPVAPTKKVKQMSDEEMESKAKNILEEYLNIRDLPEAKLCVSELAGQQNLHLFVTASLNDVLEKRDSHRELTGQLLDELIKSKNLSLDMYTKGLSEVTEFAEDMVIDIPMMWLNLAQLIAPLIIGGSVSMSTILSVLKKTVEKRCTALLLAQILLQIKGKKGEDEAAKIWQSGGCSWSEFLPDADIEDFLNDKKIGFVTKSASGTVDIYEKLAEDVEAMIRGKKGNKEILDYIEKNAGKDTQNKSFIRAITTAVASSSISQQPPIVANDDVIKSRKDILQAYIKSDTQQELQALFAIQALMTKLEHPSGVISSLFDALYDEDVISEESCKQWEKSTEMKEGKGVCSMQLTQFFTWLSENDDPENS